MVVSKNKSIQEHKLTKGTSQGMMFKHWSQRWSTRCYLSAAPTTLTTTITTTTITTTTATTGVAPPCW